MTGINRCADRLPLELLGGAVTPDAHDAARALTPPFRDGHGGAGHAAACTSSSTTSSPTATTGSSTTASLTTTVLRDDSLRPSASQSRRPPGTLLAGCRSVTALEIGLLGLLRVTVRDDELVVRGLKLRSLVAILTLHRGAPVAAEQLIDLIWDDDLPVNPNNALQAQVATARRTLGVDAIETVGGSYALHFDVAASEIPTFERLASEGRTAIGAGDHATAAARLGEALDLWRGPALADFTYLAWARPEISRLDELREAALDDRIDAELALGHDADLVGEIEARLDQDRLRERRWAQLMLALYRSGRQADALRAATEARRTLVDELGVDPGPDLAELESRILNHEVEPLAARATAAATPARLPLPAPLTRFFGRDAELAAVEAALDDARTRLVTLVGPGGAGKTRVAVEIARRGAADREAAFVALDTVTGDDAVVSAVGTALGVRRDGPGAAAGTDVLTATASLVAERTMLVVFDNCEHVIAQAARIAETLLTACPNLRVLATSREALGVRGEHLVPVGPLDPVSAAALFVDRALAVRADASLSASASYVTEICARLDGMPLAVELAAARSKALPIAQIAERLDRRFRLLTGGARTAVPRQQTLRAVVDWSYDLLFEDERELFARLSVFAGGWTLEAAEAICSDDRLPAKTILDLLAALVDKCLVLAESHGAGVRYRMLQTLSEYATEKLTASGNASGLRTRHAAWFLDVGCQAGVGLTSPQAPECRANLEADVDNLRVARNQLCKSNRAGDVLQLTTDVALLWWLRGDWAEGVGWAEVASAAATATAGAPVALAAMNEAWGAFYGGNNGDDPVEAVRRCREAVARLDRSGDRTLRARGNVVLGALLSRQRDPGLEPVARAAIDASTDGDPWFHGIAHTLAAVHKVRTGALSGATDSARRSIELLESVGDRAVIFEARSVLVTVAQLTGRLDDAETFLQDMANAARRADIRHYEEWSYTRLGVIQTARGDLDAGEAMHRAALSIGADPWADAQAHLGLAVCARRRSDFPAAREHCGRALAIHERVGAHIEQGYVHIVWAWADLDDGLPEEAQRRAALAEAAVTPPGSPSITAMATEIRAVVAADEGDLDHADKLLSDARELAPVVGHAAWWLTRPDVAALRERVNPART